MAISFEPSSLPAIGLDEFIDYVRRNVDANDDDSAIAAAPMLGALAKNRDFLRDILEKDIEGMFQPQYQSVFYTAHSCILGQSKDAVVRANIWPCVSQYAGTYRESHVNRVYSYGLPHDHNFSFLTVGYLGPGYATDIYEYDYWRAEGILGEEVEMRFLEHTTLPEHKLLFFRRGRDVHIQHPPEALSISLNLLLESEQVGQHDQYVFDVLNRKIAGYVTGCDVSRRIGVIRMASMLRDQEILERIEYVAKTAVAPRLRMGAYEALLSSRPDEREKYIGMMTKDSAQSVRCAAHVHEEECLL